MKLKLKQLFERQTDIGWLEIERKEKEAFVLFALLRKRKKKMTMNL